jgi:hypothetical protein
VGATEVFSAALHSVPDHFATAVLANWSELVDGALKAVKDVAVTRRDHFKTQLVIVPANLADCHSCKTGFCGSRTHITVICAGLKVEIVSVTSGNFAHKPLDGSALQLQMFGIPKRMNRVADSREHDPALAVIVSPARR